MFFRKNLRITPLRDLMGGHHMKLHSYQSVFFWLFSIYITCVSPKDNLLPPSIIPMPLSSLRGFHVLLLVLGLLLYFPSLTEFTLVLDARHSSNGRILGFIHPTSPSVKAVAPPVSIATYLLTSCIAFILTVPLLAFNLTLLNV